MRRFLWKTWPSTASSPTILLYPLREGLRLAYPHCARACCFPLLERITILLHHCIARFCPLLLLSPLETTPVHASLLVGLIRRSSLSQTPTLKMSSVDNTDSRSETDSIIADPVTQHPVSPVKSVEPAAAELDTEHPTTVTFRDLVVAVDSLLTDL